jgi:hypothetical protein
LRNLFAADRIGYDGRQLRPETKTRKRKNRNGRTHLLAIQQSDLSARLRRWQQACRHRSKGTPSGAYTITVTGTYASGSLVHNTPVTLTVQ